VDPTPRQLPIIKNSIHKKNDKKATTKESSSVEFCMPSFTGQLIQWMEVHHTSISPDTKTMIVVGDNADGLFSDSQGGKVN
jgi:hypothetical protein